MQKLQGSLDEVLRRVYQTLALLFPFRYKGGPLETPGCVRDAYQKARDSWR